MSLLSSSRFVRLDPSQLGLPLAPVAQCAVEFGGHLYVGTGRIGAGDLDIPARILRRDPEGHWHIVLETPEVDSGKLAPFADRQLPMAVHYAQRERLARSAHFLDTGYVSMAVFKGKDDPAPALYVATLSVGGGRLLRSVDGEIFRPVCEPGMGNPGILGFAALTVFGDRLYVAASGSVSDGIVDRQQAGACLIYCSDNPVAGLWAPATEPGFGDEGNGAVTCLHAGDGHLYAGTSNRERGYQLWRAVDGASLPLQWERLIVDGAYGFTSNPVATAIATFDGSLYVASGTDGAGYDNASDVGPSAIELIRLSPTGEWELIIGQPRFTPSGLKVPLAMMGPGLDDPFNANASALVEWKGALYLGTTQWEAFRALELEENLVGGFQLWASTDGTEWHAVLDEGGGAPSCVSITALYPTETQLWATTANYAVLLELMAQLGNHRVPSAQSKNFALLLGH